MFNGGIMKENEKVIRQNIENLSYYKIKDQMFIWIEELSELTKVICKWARVYDELEGDITEDLLEQFHDEITDNTICLDQMKYVIHFLEDDLMKHYKVKVERQANRIENERNNNNI